MLKADHQDLPAAARTGSHPNQVQPVIGLALAKAWGDTLGENFRAKAADTVFRASWAGMCARAMHYNAANVPPSNPPDVADRWRMLTGTILHDRVDEYVKAAFPDAEVEVVVVIDDLVSCHADIVLTIDDQKVAVEVKSINGWGFKSSIGARGDAEGPKISHVLQGAMAAYGLDADQLRIVYLSLENLSPREAERQKLSDPAQRFLAEWSYDRDEYRPLAEAELERMRRIRGRIDSDVLAPRVTPEMPSGARVTDPRKGLWVSLDATESGTIWQCGYCDHRDTCLSDGPS